MQAKSLHYKGHLPGTVNSYLSGTAGPTGGRVVLLQTPAALATLGAGALAFFEVVAALDAISAEQSPWPAAAGLFASHERPGGEAENQADFGPGEDEVVGALAAADQDAAIWIGFHFCDDAAEFEDAAAFPFFLGF